MTNQQGLNDEELAAWRSFMAMQHTLGRHLSRYLKEESGLSDSDFEILVNLSECAHGQMRAVQLAAATQWDKSRLSHHLSRMEKRGLIRRQACDDRYPDIALTDAGRNAFIASASANATRVRRFFIDVLGPDRLATLREAANDVIAAVEGHLARNDCPSGVRRA